MGSEGNIRTEITSTVDSLFSVKGKTTLITGAASGLGRHFAILFARNGANVIAADINASALEKVVSEINNFAKDKNGGTSPGTAIGRTVDVTKTEAELTPFVEEAWKLYGRIDILLNCAGIVFFGSPLEETEEQWEKLMAVNLFGYRRTCKLLAMRMSADGIGGSIVNIASCCGNSGGCLPALTAYGTSKAAVQKMTQHLALELGPLKIRVNSLSPGFFVTGMTQAMVDDVAEFYNTKTPLRRMGDIEKDLDGPMLLLASDAGAYMTGVNLTADGGLTLTQFHP